MRYAVSIVIVLLWSMLIGQLKAQDLTNKIVTATNLADMCKDGRRTVGEAFCAGFLFGIKAGIAQTYANYGCAPPSVSVAELRNMLVKYIDEHPESQSEDVRSVTIAVIDLAFPCKQAMSDNQSRMSVSQPRRATTYDTCILENASAVEKAGNDNALDVIMLSCIKEHEESIGDDDIGKIKVQSLSYGALGFTGMGLIAQIYNGSEYNLTAIKFVLNDKKTKEQRAYDYNQFIHFYKGPGIPTGLPAPQYRRFIRKHMLGEYTFPLEFPGLVQNEFFKKYEVLHFTARGVR